MIRPARCRAVVFTSDRVAETSDNGDSMRLGSFFRRRWRAFIAAASIVCAVAIGLYIYDLRARTFDWPYPIESATKIVYVRRMKPSGRLEQFEVSDAEAIQKVANHLRNAKEATDERGFECGVSLDYEIGFFTENGNQVGKPISVCGIKLIHRGRFYFIFTAGIKELDRAVEGVRGTPVEGDLPKLKR